MLAPDTRAVAVELLRPPEGYRLDQAVLCTYSLDLETLLALPLAVLAQSDAGLDALLENPMLIVEGLRAAGERLHVFADHGALAIPRTHRDLFALLEPCVHPVAAPGGGAFHPKVWVARFVNEEGEVRIRSAVLSRNLTFDRSWDLALVSEATKGSRASGASGGLAELLRALPEMASESLDTPTRDAVLGLARDVERCTFDAPPGFFSHVEYEPIGIQSGGPRWAPKLSRESSRVLAIAPFVSAAPLETLRKLGPYGCTLIGRGEELDKLPEDAASEWTDALTLSDAMDEEAGDDTAGQPSGLHAKAIALEHGWDVTWWIGSANLTNAAWSGRNVELMARLSARRGRAEGNTGQGIDRFLNSGFGALCQPYLRSESDPDPERAEAEARAAEAHRAIRDADLRVRCEQTATGWTWTLSGALHLPEGVDVYVWPVSRREDERARLSLPLSLPVPRTSLTAFAAFHVEASPAPAVRFVRKLPADGLPEDRVHTVLCDLIRTPERLLRFLRALLGGLDGLVEELGIGAERSESGNWNAGPGDETLLEDFVRVASRSPERLTPIGRLLEELQQTEEGREVIPPGLLETWQAVAAAMKEAKR